MYRKSKGGMIFFNTYSSVFVFTGMIISAIGFLFVIFIYIIERREYKQTAMTRAELKRLITEQNKTNGHLALTDY